MSFRNVPALIVFTQVKKSTSFGRRFFSRCVGKFPKFEIEPKVCGNRFKNAFLSTSTNCCSIYNYATVKDTIEADLPEFGHPLESWYYDVNKFGKVVIRSPMSIHIQPLNPNRHPNMNKLFLNILYIGNEKLHQLELTNLAKTYIVSVSLDDQNEEIDVSVTYKNGETVPNTVCHLQVPMKYDVDVCCKNEGDTSVERLEGENIKVKTQNGNCYLTSIKSGTVNIKTGGGSIISRNHLQGNAKLMCRGQGEIHAGRLQGQTVECESEAGDINVKAIYADTATFESVSGNTHLGSCHGNSNVIIQNGNLNVDSLDGSLNSHIAAGDTSVYIARAGHLSVKTGKGDIELKVPQSLETKVVLVAEDIETGEITLEDQHESQQQTLTKITGDIVSSESSTAAGQIDAKTNNGTITLLYQDWFSSLNLTTQS